MSNFIIMEQLAYAVNHLEYADGASFSAALLSVIQSTSDDKTSDLLTYVKNYLGAHHLPGLIHVQYELVKVVSDPMAIKHRVVAKVFQVESANINMSL